MNSSGTHNESSQVRRTLGGLRDLPRSAAFQELSTEERKRIASALRDLAGRAGALKATRVWSALSERGALAEELRLPQQRHGGAEVSQKDRLDKLVDPVDFPPFVATLIGGVFNAIVDGSIQQMEAYSKLLSEVAQTIEEGCKKC